uniref:Asparagine-rich zinc finger protein AZF1-like n=1 Tax=Saccoglossus kowalevskii TaxID=10224 RepID=A0ABM0MDL6_SACKO|nr:PREDICTED: asparagine-rich zinc finger protein AZF1-like [Saccoglossus kowalevskii]
MERINISDQESIATRELKRALFQKCHGLSLLTGCQIFLHIEDKNDGVQFYGNQEQVKRFLNGQFLPNGQEKEVSGETGLLKTPVVNSNSNDKSVYTSTNEISSDEIPNSTTNPEVTPEMVDKYNENEMNNNKHTNHLNTDEKNTSMDKTGTFVPKISVASLGKKFSQVMIKRVLLEQEEEERQKEMRKKETALKMENKETSDNTDIVQSHESIMINEVYSLDRNSEQTNNAEISEQNKFDNQRSQAFTPNEQQEGYREYVYNHATNQRRESNTEQREPINFSARDQTDEIGFINIQQDAASSSDSGISTEALETSSPNESLPAEIPYYKIASKSKRRYQCGICGKAFTQLSVLKEHMKTHTGEKPYICKQCGKEFSHPSNFKRHERLVHSGSGERRHQCPVCLKAFPLSHHLKEHFRIHSGERPYQCKVCGQKFKQSSTLKTHQKRHFTKDALNVDTNDLYQNATDMSQQNISQRHFSSSSSPRSIDGLDIEGIHPNHSNSSLAKNPSPGVVKAMEGYNGVPHADDVVRNQPFHPRMLPVHHLNMPTTELPKASKPFVNVQSTQFSMDAVMLQHTSKFGPDGNTDSFENNSPTRVSRYPPPLIHCRSKDWFDEDRELGNKYKKTRVESNDGNTMLQQGNEQQSASDDADSTRLSPIGSEADDLLSATKGHDSNQPFEHIKVKLEVPDEQVNKASSCIADENTDDNRSSGTGYAGSSEMSGGSGTDSDSPNHVQQYSQPGLYPLHIAAREGTMVMSQTRNDYLNCFHCKVCDTFLSSAATFHEHQKVCHGLGTSDQHMCHLCRRSFSNQSNFKRHLRLMHSGTKVRRHQCLVCFKAFPLGHHLKEHFRIHSGERPYKCEVCGKGFTQSSTLKNHRKTHAQEKASYHCTNCNRRFPDAQMLMDHRMQHIIESCKCPTCGKQCRSPYELGVHRMKEYCSSNNMQSRQNLSEQQAMPN